VSQADGGRISPPGRCPDLPGQTDLPGP